MLAYIYLCKSIIGRLNIGDFIQKLPKFTTLILYGIYNVCRFRPMDNLSGGEKTVAALALLFAIHRYYGYLEICVGTLVYFVVTCICILLCTCV